MASSTSCATPCCAVACRRAHGDFRRHQPDRDSRKRARKIAREAGAPALTLLTVAPPDVVAHRLQQRTTGEAEAYASDADWAVHEKLAATVEAMNAAHEPYVLVDTSKEIVPVLRLVDEFLARARASTPALEAQQAS